MQRPPGSGLEGKPGMYTVDRAAVDRLWSLKEEIAGEAARHIRDTRRARRDSHARRRPIPCGLTIHTGVGCSYGCSYCYIYDMGFTGKPSPYPLTGWELVYALAVNPHLAPGPYGTLLAFGSVTEPFMPETRERALEYLRLTRDMLGNPQQVSTKTALQGRWVERLVESADPRIDVLVSIATLRHWRLLEPGASPPLERIRFMGRLVEAGLGATLFLRPILPGVTDREAGEILEQAARVRVRRVVLGTLRVTPRILERLAATRVVDVEFILGRLPRRPRGRDQVPIRARDLKEGIASMARGLGFEVLPASCSSNIASHGLSCAACKMGPCGSLDSLPRVGAGAVEEILVRAGLEPVEARVEGVRVFFRYRGGSRGLSVAYSWIASLLKRVPVGMRAG